MECVICKYGTMVTGFTTVTLEKNNTIVVIKEVPAHICDNCGHYYLSEEFASQVLAIAEDSVQKGIEIEVTRFKVAS